MVPKVQTPYPPKQRQAAIHQTRAHYHCCKHGLIKTSQQISFVHKGFTQKLQRCVSNRHFLFTGKQSTLTRSHGTLQIVVPPGTYTGCSIDKLHSIKQEHTTNVAHRDISKLCQRTSTLVDLTNTALPLSQSMQTSSAT